MNKSKTSTENKQKTMIFIGLAFYPNEKTKKPIKPGRKRELLNTKKNTESVIQENNPIRNHKNHELQEDHKNNILSVFVVSIIFD